MKISVEKNAQATNVKSAVECKCVDPAILDDGLSSVDRHDISFVDEGAQSVFSNDERLKVLDLKSVFFKPCLIVVFWRHIHLI